MLAWLFFARPLERGRVPGTAVRWAAVPARRALRFKDRNPDAVNLQSLPHVLRHLTATEPDAQVRADLILSTLRAAQARHPSAVVFAWPGRW